MHHVPSRLLIATVAAALPALVVTVSNAAAPPTTTVNFGFQWKDYGNTAHPLVSDNVLFFDQNAGGPGGIPFATGTTNAAGQYQLVTNYTNADLSGNIQIQPGLVAQINGVGTGFFNQAAANPLIYFPAGSGAYGASINQTTSYNSISFISTSNEYRALTALQYIKVEHDFYGDTSSYNATLPSIRLNYNSTNVGSSMGASIMNLDGQDWGNVDVLFHEYGHHVAEFNNLEGTTYGLQHSFGADNISGNNGGYNYGNGSGSHLAWQEGIATYLGMVATREASINAKLPGIPADAQNYTYDQYAPPIGNQTISSSDFAWSVAINSLQVKTIATAPDPEGHYAVGSVATFNSHGAGEGDEMSVMRTLWDFEQNTNVQAYDRANQQDYSNYGGTSIFNLMKNVPAGANKGTFYTFWQGISADVRTAGGKAKVGLAGGDPDALAVVRLGMTLEENAISSAPVTFGAFASLTPDIQWTIQNNSNSTLYKVLIYSTDWTTLVQQSPQLAGAGTDDWVVANPLNPGTYNYVVLNNSVLASVGDLTNNYNWYWSGFSTITVPEPASIFVLMAGGGILLVRRKKLR